MTIRDSTKYEEVIGVRRHWVYPWRKLAEEGSSIQGSSSIGRLPVYYDIAILELGM